MAASALRQVQRKQPSSALEQVRAPEVAVARGALVRTAEGREYVDFDNGGGSVLLGHADPDVEAAVAAERRSARRLSGPLADRLIDFLPGAEDVRFFHSADQALTAAFAAARRATGRERVLSCVASADAFAYADVAALAGSADLGEVAAIAVEPLKVLAPCRRELAALRQLADRSGAALIFDERRSALRVHEGGAQAMFGVQPDLTIVGEALANGRPLAALAGRLDVMALVSGVSAPVGCLAAATAVIDKLAREPVLANLAIRGSEVQALLAQRIRGCGAQEIVSVGGDPTAPALSFTIPNGRGLWLRELWAQGVWCMGEHYISYAHGDREIGQLLTACEAALEVLMRAATPPRCLPTYEVVP